MQLDQGNLDHARNLVDLLNVVQNVELLKWLPVIGVNTNVVAQMRDLDLDEIVFSIRKANDAVLASDTSRLEFRPKKNTRI